MPIDIGDPVAQRANPIPLDGAYPGVPLPAKDKTAEQNYETLKRLEQWYMEQVDAHAENRREQLLDCDFYDHEQWDEESKRILAERNQAPLVFNLIAPTLNWIIGTEARTRVDWKVHPRKESDIETAEAKQKTLKFVSDVNEAAFERSAAFKDSVKAGVGWVREFWQPDGDPIPVGVCHVPWQMVRYDPFSRKNDLGDCKSISIERYVDIDYALMRWPWLADELRAKTTNQIDPSMELLDDDITVPGVFWGSRPGYQRIGMSLKGFNYGRQRLQLIETEYRHIRLERKVRALSDDYIDVDGKDYNLADGAMNDLLRRQVVALDDRPVDTICHAIWTPGLLLQNQPLPYKHNRFSVTPLWCYRRMRDGKPYGIIRGLRDPQEEYNKRRSKALHAISTARVKYEADAIEEGEEDNVLAEAAKPNGQIRLAPGALSGHKFELETATDISMGHVQLMEQSRQHINEGSGVTRENLGQESGAVSGRAIIAKQQQGAVTTAEVFDNYRRMIQQSGRKTLKLCEQFLTQPMQVRVEGANGLEWVGINQPSIDPLTGEVVFANDMTASEADFIVDQQDYRETVRMAMAETLFETIRNLQPDMQMQLLDLAVDLTDLPNRAEIVKRIRDLNGQNKVGQPQTPEEAAAAQQQQQEAELAAAERMAKVDKDRATAEKYRADARATGVKAKGEAMNVAGLIEAAIPLAPAADRLLQPPNQPGA